MGLKKGDMLVLVILIAAGLAWLGVDLLQGSGSGGQIVIEIDGQTYKAIPFIKGMEQRDIHIELEQGRYIDIVADESGAYVKEVVCPDKLCQKTGIINKTGQSIVCLPNKVVVFIEGKDDSDVDHVSY